MSVYRQNALGGGSEVAFQSSDYAQKYQSHLGGSALVSSYGFLRAQSEREGVLRARNRLRRQDELTAVESVRFHWPEYVMEAGELAAYMFVTCVFAALVHHPASPLRHWIAGGIPRRALWGLAMAATVIGIVMSPWGKQSGAHFNPAVTFTFYRLGKVALWDTVFYATGQFLGAISGVAVAAFVLRGTLMNHAVRYAVTAPGVYGSGVAFVAELMISFILMTTVLVVTNHERFARYTAYFVAGLVAIYYTFEAPLSGMSTNPARTFGSALHAGYWRAVWVYFIAPTIGMLGASEVFLRVRGGVGPFCAKLHHANNKRCIFHHGYRTAWVPGDGKSEGLRKRSSGGAEFSSQEPAGDKRKLA